jgi:hypothetical protein
MDPNNDYMMEQFYNNTLNSTYCKKINNTIPIKHVFCKKYVQKSFSTLVFRENAIHKFLIFGLDIDDENRSFYLFVAPKYHNSIWPFGNLGINQYLTKTESDKELEILNNILQSLGVRCNGADYVVKGNIIIGNVVLYGTLIRYISTEYIDIGGIAEKLHNFLPVINTSFQ